MKKTGNRVAPESRREPLQTDETRASRAQADAERVDEGFEMSQDEREQMLRDNALQSRLPDPPKRPGVHWFWGSLNNTANSIMWYMRLGYRPVKFEELAGWAEANMRGKSGDYAGCICVEEMLLLAGDEKAYQRYMHIVHHEKPMQEQMGVKDQFRRTQDEVASESGHGGLVQDPTRPGEMSGLRELERTVKRPAKFE